MSAKVTFGWAGVSLALGGIILGFFLAAATLGTGAGGPAEITPAAPRGPLGPEEQRIIDVFQKASPSVVNISTSVLRRSLFSLNVLEIPQGTGTGFIWDREGHIVTNYHVIRSADRLVKYSVTLADRSTYPAKIVGEYPDKDLAVLKIEAPQEKLPPVSVGSSADLMVGQTVLAIGNPFGLDQTLTTGVISALGREVKGISGRLIQEVIQTDAAINQGNSGGPLLDSNGRLIGVNFMIFSPSGTSAGIGFAVPIDTIRNVVPQLIEHGRVIRPVIGITAVRDDIARQAGIQEGIVVYEVSPDSGAARAGLRGVERTRDGDLLVRDVIVEIDGRPVNRLDHLLNLLEKRRAGDEVEVVYIRGGEKRRVKVRLDESK